MILGLAGRIALPVFLKNLLTYEYVNAIIISDQEILDPINKEDKKMTKNGRMTKQEQMLVKLSVRQERAEAAGNHKEWERLQKQIEQILREIGGTRV